MFKPRSARSQNLHCLPNLRPALGNPRSKINALQNHRELAATLQGDPWDAGEALPSLLAALHAGLCSLGLLREVLLGMSGQPKDSWPLPCPALDTMCSPQSLRIIRAKQMLSSSSHREQQASPEFVHLANIY